MEMVGKLFPPTLVLVLCPNILLYLPKTLHPGASLADNSPISFFDSSKNMEHGSGTILNSYLDPT